jgi:surface protein
MVLFDWPVDSMFPCSFGAERPSEMLQHARHAHAPAILVAVIAVVLVAAGAGSSFAQELRLDAARGVLVATVPIEAPNVAVNVSARLQALQAAVAQLQCALCAQYGSMGSCITTETGEFVRCTCAPGWTGLLCDTRANSSGDACGTCEHGGICVVDEVRGPVCFCRNGFSGSRCEVQNQTCFGAASCPAGSVCLSSTTAAAGPVCAVIVPEPGTPCITLQCRNGGSCVVDANRDARCVCAAQFTGQLCDLFDACQSSPCQNLGVCESNTTAAHLFRCTCRSGFTGPRCEIDIDECASAPCRSGGRCVQSVNTGAFVCICPPGLSGSMCQQSISECSSSPCRFGASCVQGLLAYRRFICSSFVTQWNTSMVSPGSSLAHQIRLPLEASGSYNFVVQWGDGTNQTITAAAQAVRNYTQRGVYNVTITGLLRGWRFNNGGDRFKLLNVMQWGTMQLRSSGAFFWGAANMVITAIDAPDLSGVTDFSYAFMGASALTTGIAHWDVSNMTTMRSTFSDALQFNDAIGLWDVSRVTDIAYMFDDAVSFNQDLEFWDVSRVTDMERVFNNALSFNRPIGRWNVSRVTDMSSMFRFASVFNQAIGSWDVSNVTLMSSMFLNATAFNQPIGAWNVGRVTLMFGMFQGAVSFNQPIGDWNVARVTSTDYMFFNATSFNQPIGRWNVSSVTIMTGMFYRALSFDQDLSGWCVSRFTQKPWDFDMATPTSWTTARKPVWGTCPLR